jgi:FkbM family methyltransferase
MNINYFFKLKYYLGTSNAIQLFWNKIIKSKRVSVNFIAYPFVIRHHDFADWQIFNEVILKRAYMGLLNDKDAKLNIIDLGGNIGLASISFLSEFINCNVITVEPEKRNFDLLLQNVAPYNRCIAINAAVSPKNGELFVYDSLTGSHGFRTSGVINKNTISSVRAISINEIIKTYKLDRIDILKIDIEGAEFELFSENTEWLNIVDLMVIETHDKFGLETTKKVFKTLETYQYTAKVVNNNIVIKFLRQF